MIPLLNLCRGQVGEINYLHSLRSIKNTPSFLFVGGIVRDYIIHLTKSGSKPKILSPSVFLLPIDSFAEFLNSKHDIDIATILPPKDAAKVLDQTFPKSDRIRQFATNAIKFNNTKVDCTSTRIDTECDGRHAKMEFGVSYFQDSFRRDFTFNAMYMSSHGLVFDFHNGLKHLMQHEIHFIGDTKTRILEDYTRIKRYYDFSGRFNVKNAKIEEIIDDIIANSKTPIKMR